MKRLLLCLGLLLPLACFGQQYSIDWYTIAGGGGSSSNSQYLVSGTIGQPATGSMSGGNFSLTGGFWSLYSVVQTPGAPLLTLQLTATNTVVLSWPAGSTTYGLEQSSLLSPPSWDGVTNSAVMLDGQNQVTLGLSAGNRFFRLKAQ